MHIAFTVKHFELSDHTKTHIQEKLDHLSHVIADIQDVVVRCSRGSRHRKGKIMEVSVDVRTSNHTFFASTSGSDVESCIDEITDELKEQVRKFQGKQEGKLRKTIRLRRWMKSILFWRQS